MAVKTYTFVGPKLPEDWALQAINVDDAVLGKRVIHRGEQFQMEEKLMKRFLSDRYNITEGVVGADPVDDPDKLKSIMASNTGLDARPRSSALPQRNDFQNPRAVGAAPAFWSATFGVGAANTSNPGVNDPDLGTSMSAKADYPGDFNGHAVNFGKSVANAVVKTIRPLQDFSHLITYFRVKVKVVSGPAVPMAVKLHAYTQDGNGANVRDVGIDYRDGVMVGDIFTLEGFDVSVASGDRVGGYVTIEATGSGGPSTVELRATNAQIVVDPIAEPRFGSGGDNRWTWRGAANASGSDGWASRESLTEKFPGGWGFQGTTQYDRQTDTAAMGPEREVLLLSSMGVTMHRGDLAVSGAWPQGDPKPNWRNPGIKWFADYMDAARRHGLKACPIIGAPLGWMTTDGAADNAYSLRTLDPVRYDDFALLYTSLIDEWPDVISAVELFNEPNFVSVWGAAPNPALFSQHMLALLDRFKDKHPTVKVVGPALARAIDGTPAGTAMGAQTFLQGLYDAGLGHALDAISIHPYSNSTMTGWDAAATNGNQGGFNYYINEILKVMRVNGDGAKKIWITENGGNYLDGGTWTHRNVAIYNMLCRVIAARRPEIEAYFTHSFMDTYQQAAGSRGFGNFDIDKGTPRLTFYAQADGKLPEADWINIPMASGWVPLDANSAPAQYKILPDGDVRVRGQIKGGSAANASIGVLPFKMPLPRVGWFNAMGLSGSTWLLAMIQVNGDGSFFANQAGSTTGLIFDFTFTPGAA